MVFEVARALAGAQLVLFLLALVFRRTSGPSIQRILGRSNFCFATSLFYLLAQAHLVHITSLIGPSLLQLQLTFNRETFCERVLAWNADQRAQYIGHFPIDCAFPFAYGLSLCSLLAWRGERRKSVLVLPWIACACDLWENGMHWVAQQACSARRAVPLGLVPVSGTVSAIKWGLAIFCVTRVATGAACPAPPNLKAKKI